MGHRRQCRVCGLTKDEADYYRDGGYCRRICRACRKTQMREYSRQVRELARRAVEAGLTTQDPQ